MIGVISDTHGLLRPEAIEALRGVSHIIHAGDVDGVEIIRQLEAIAPVTVVRGNVDNDAWGRSLPLSDLVEIEGVWCGVFHGHLPPQLDFKVAGARLVVSGHTHVPQAEVRDGILFLNPGSAGPKRFSLPVSLARITVDGAELRPEFVSLAVH